MEAHTQRISLRVICWNYWQMKIAKIKQIFQIISCEGQSMLNIFENDMNNYY